MEQFLIYLGYAQKERAYFPKMNLRRGAKGYVLNVG
jgi:hypothetical protein